MGLPSKLTHEEQALLNKFALLKKKKKVLQTPKTTSIETSNKNTLKVLKKESAIEKIKVKTAAPKDAKEIAKRLIASGQVKLNKSNENRSFKRARPHGEKKVKELSLSEAAFGSKDQVNKIDGIKKEPYSNFVSSNNQPNETDEPPPKQEFRRNNFDRKRQGNSLFVQGYGLTKAIMEAAFVPLGTVTNIFMDNEKGNGTVTYHDKELAEKAMSELHGSMIQGVTLRVAYARRRPYDDNRYTYRPKHQKPGMDNKGPHERHERPRRERHDFDRQPSEPATSPTVTSPVKREPKEKRKLLNYDEEGFDF